MKLPILSHPTFEIDIPSSHGKLKHKYRPMLVKEEKILLMAKKEGTSMAMYRAIEQVLAACFHSSMGTVVPSLKEVQKYTLFDMEYVFLKLRGQSVSNVVKVMYKDSEDGKDYPFEVNLDELKVKFPEKEDFMVVTHEGLKAQGFIMKYPMAQIYGSNVFSRADVMPEDLMQELIVWCVESFFSGDTSIPFAGLPRFEIDSFMANLDLASYEKLKTWVSTLPRLNHEISYQNSLGNTRKIEMTTLSDFFTL